MPLYLDPAARFVARLAGAHALPAQANAGLVFDRYLPLWEGACEAPQRVELGPPLHAFADAFNRRGLRDGPARTLAACHARLDRALGTDALRLDYEVAWRLAIGLGGEHPTENGLTFDSGVGVPLIPGAAVKGLCRAAASALGWEASEIERLFGPEVRPGEPARQGALRFFDAWPTPWPRLAVDVVNCHHPAYYHRAEPTRHDGQPDRERYPRETENPVPVFFLAVDAPTRFTFRIAPALRGGTHPERMREALHFGLTTLGIGAKTAVGYGVMGPAANR